MKSATARPSESGTSSPANGSFDTIVLGAGISGLSHAHALGEDAKVLVLERSQRAGGLVHTKHVDAPVPLRYEAGPESLTATEDIETLASELGLPLAAVPAHSQKRFIVLAGALAEIPTAPPKLLGSRLLSLRGKLRLLSEPWRRGDRALDGSIADFVSHRIGKEALDVLVDPLVSGIHAGAPELLSMRACFPQAVAMVEEHGSFFGAMRAGRKRTGPKKKRAGLAKPQGGMQGLTDALAAALSGKLRTGTEVRGLQPTADGWRVETGDGPLQARRIVSALPLEATTRLLATTAPDASAALGDMQRESLISVDQLVRREDVAHALDGFGYLAPSREGLRHLGTLFSSSIDPACVPAGFVLLRTLLGGARRPELLDESDETLLAIVEQEVHPLLGIRVPPRWVAVERHARTLPRFDLGHVERVQRVQAALPPGLTVLGNFTHGIGLAALVAEARREARAAIVREREAYSA